MTQQSRADWQPHRGDKIPRESGDFQSQQHKDIALTVPETPLHEEQQSRDAVGGRQYGAKREPRAAGEGPEGC